MEHIQCLIVDDEIPLAESTVEYFNLFEVSSEAVFDAESCLAFLRTHTVDLILLDINLGGASGFDLCKAGHTSRERCANSVYQRKTKR